MCTRNVTNEYVKLIDDWERIHIPWSEKVYSCGNNLSREGGRGREGEREGEREREGEGGRERERDVSNQQTIFQSDNHFHIDYKMRDEY